MWVDAGRLCGVDRVSVLERRGLPFPQILNDYWLCGTGSLDVLREHAIP